VHVSSLVWIISLIVVGVILAVDLVVIGRRPHVPSTKECALWVAFYVGLAIAFGIAVSAIWGTGSGGEFFAGWLTEYSLSVDNLFVFVIIMARFKVPKAFQQKALLIGIVLALAMRGIFIALGAAALNRFEWIFYIFGAFLVYTAVNLVRHGETDDSDYKDNLLTRLSRRILPISRDFNHGHLTTHRDGKRMFTQIILVVVALGTTDLIFALDSIPAIFGLTKVAYLVFAANVFALMGLRQLYFLLGDLLDRLRYLSLGLAAVLAFIGVKLILEALHGNNLPFINGGEPIGWAPHIPIWLSLSVIIVTLGVATVASLISAKRRGEPLSLHPDKQSSPADVGR
jgi:tellurite resistance protein TerC